MQGSLGNAMTGMGQAGMGAQPLGRNPNGGFVQKSAGNQDGSVGGPSFNGGAQPAGGGGGCCGSNPQAPSGASQGFGGGGMMQPSVMPPMGGNQGGVNPTGPGFQAGGWDQQNQQQAQAQQLINGAQPRPLPAPQNFGGAGGSAAFMGGQSGGGQHPWSPGAGQAQAPNSGWGTAGQNAAQATVAQNALGSAGAPQGQNIAMNPNSFTGQNTSGNSNDALYNAIATGNQGALNGAGSQATNSAINAAAGGGGGGNSAGYLDWYKQNQTRLNQQGPMYQPGGMFYNPAIDGQAPRGDVFPNGG
jgi:hypothetical protein